MPKYNVNIPFAGYITVGVDADDEDAAVKLAIDNVELRTELKTHGAVDYAEIAEFDLYRRLAAGSVYYAPLLQVEVEEEDAE